MEQVEEAAAEYRNICQQVYGTVWQQVQAKLPALAESEVAVMVNSLILDAYYKVTGSSGLGFSYETQKDVEDDKIWWHLQFGEASFQA